MSDESNQFSVGLCHEFEITARKAGWEPKDLALLAHNEVKCQEVLAFVRGESVIQAIRRFLAISRVGNSVYTGTGLATWLGKKSGDGLKGEPQRDPRSLALTELDIEKIEFKHYIDLDEGETVITGENRVKAIKASGDIGLDAQIGWDLYKENDQKSLRWLYDNRGVSWMEFPEVLRYPDGNRCFLYLYRDCDGGWRWYYYWLDNDRSVSSPAAVLCK